MHEQFAHYLNDYVTGSKNDGVDSNKFYNHRLHICVELKTDVNSEKYFRLFCNIYTYIHIIARIFDSTIYPYL